MKEKRVYACHNCLSVFEIISTTRRMTPLCINCGDWVDVKRLAEKEKRDYKKWTDEEVDKLKELLNNGLQHHTIAFILDRTHKSVKRKVQRMKRGMDNVAG